MTQAIAARKDAMDIRPDALTSAATQALLRLHLEGMHASSPPGEVFALDLSGLTAADVSVWSAWAGETILGIAALRRIDAETGEVKSMRTHPGSGLAFEPAIALYRKRGFLQDEAFGDYRQTAFSQFCHFALA